MPKGTFKRLNGSYGQISGNDPSEGDNEDQIRRPAILVHAGPNGSAIQFQSGDGPIDFDDARIQRLVKNHNAKIMDMANQYGGLEKTPLGAFPPILDMHEDESNDRVIGRLACLLKFERRDVPKVGKNVACAVADPGITFLGKETVTKVKDGRIYHLSIGIDETTDTLGETSTVIEPAAPGAMLLSGKKGASENTNEGRTSMPKKDLKRMKAHADRMAKLTAIEKELTGLTQKAVGTKSLIQLNSRQRVVTHRLNKLMTDRKMTPAEFKLLDITKLSKMDEETFDMLAKSYETRIAVEGAQRGSTDAVEFSEIGKNLEARQEKRLKAEIKGDFRKLGKKLALGPEDKEHGDDKEMGGGNKESAVNPGQDPHSVHGPQGGVSEEGNKVMAAHLAKMREHLAAGNMDGVKQCHAEMEKHMASGKHMSFGGDVKSEDEKESYDKLQGQVDEIHTNMARLAGMVSELMDGEKAEGQELEKGEDADPVVDEKDKMKKEMGLDDKDKNKQGDKASA